MPDPSKPVPFEAVEAAAKAMWEVTHPGKRLPNSTTLRKSVGVRDAIHAFLDAMGMRVEEDFSTEEQHPDEYRLVSRWFPIKGPVDE